MTYDSYGRTEPSRIYLARPGKQMLGCLNGANEDSCNINIQLVDANEISFDVYKYHDEELTSWYDYIDVMMELFVDGYGWYVIDESPTIRNDGIKEYKSVSAKSYEYMLNRYDLYGFDVNTASPTSAEMLAEDNVYTYHTSTEVWYNIFRDNVLFYRDSSEHDALLSEIDDNTTYEQLQEVLAKYPHVIYQDWRITVPIGSELRAGLVEMKNSATTQAEADHWQSWIDAYDTNTGVTSESVKTLMLQYPELITHIKVEFDKKKYEMDDDGKYVDSGDEYSAYEIMTLESKRIKGLSLMDLVLSDVPGWSVGYVDPDIPEGKTVQLKDEVGRFEVDSQDVYSFLITELSGFFECIFTFDTINNKVNAYRIESLGEDTKIFLGFRNVQNSVDITPAQELFTQFTVENSDGLSILYANFGEREIEDISYFLNEKYLPTDTISHYNSWLEFKESKREEYIQKSREYNSKYEEAQEIMNRVPSDMLNISQLANYTSKDQIEQMVGNNYALMIGMLNSFIYVSTENTHPPGEPSSYNTYDEYITAMNAYIAELEALVDVNKEETVTAFEDSLFYNDYYMVKTFTIPNLVIAHDNLDLYSYETQKDYYDAFEYNFAEKDQGGYGWMYGVKELENYQKTHEDKMSAYKEFEVAWDDIPDTEEGRRYKASYTEEMYTEKHNLYMKYKNGYDSATAALARRKAEYDSVMAELDDISETRQAIADSVKKENYNGFTSDDLFRINNLMKHTDYVNDNINYLENIDNVNTIIDKHKEMYDEAIEELFMESHPQYTYSTSVDDLLANNEYEDYHPDFIVGNFIRLGLDDITQVKLRLIGIQFNPMIYDKNLSLTFSNMIRYRAKRNDFANLLNSAMQSAKNSINARYSRSADNDNTVQVTYDLVQKILQNSSFTSAMQNVQAGSVSAASGAFNSLTSDFIKTGNLSAKVAEIESISADSAFFKYLEGNLVVASEIRVDDLKAKLAQVDTITAGSAFANYLATVSSTAAQSTITDAYIRNAVMRAVSVADLKAGTITLTDQMRIVSQNENGGNVLFNGSTLQFADDEGNVGIQIGYGNSSKPSMIIKDEDGQSMFTSTGITSAGIPDGIIVDDMIQDSTISKDKLGFNVVEGDENGNVSITKVLDPEGGNFGVEYTTFKNTTNDAIEEIENKKMYRVIVESDNGNIFKNNEISCTLSCHVYSWDDEITDDINAANFIWKRKSNNASDDEAWNARHASGKKSITLTSSDVYGRSVFYCTVTLPDGVEITGG